MPLYFDENHARNTLTMAAVVEALRNIFLEEAEGHAVNVPRTRSPLFGKSVNVTAAADEKGERFAVKIYGLAKSHILLYTKTGELLSVASSDWLGRLRTGAASGLATSLMTPQAVGRVGLIGAGRQAGTQLHALKAVGKLRDVMVYARNRKNLEAFCTQMESELACAVTPAENGERAVRDADIVVTATKSSTPVLKKAWLAPGAHINAIGANAAQRVELEPDIVTAATSIVTDDPVQAREEAGEFIQLAQSGAFDWDRVESLSSLVRSGGSLRDSKSLTLFKSLGVGLEDLAISSLLYDLTVESGAPAPFASR